MLRILLCLVPLMSTLCFPKFFRVISSLVCPYISFWATFSACVTNAWLYFALTYISIKWFICNQLLQLLQSSASKSVHNKSLEFLPQRLWYIFRLDLLIQIFDFYKSIVWKIQLNICKFSGKSVSRKNFSESKGIRVVNNVQSFNIEIRVFYKHLQHQQ